jgi:hypothetical protein
MLKRTVLWAKLVPTHPYQDGQLAAVPVAYKEVRGLAGAFNLLIRRRAQSGGAFDDKSELFA